MSISFIFGFLFFVYLIFNIRRINNLFNRFWFSQDLETLEETKKQAKLVDNFKKRNKNLQKQKQKIINFKKENKK